MRIEDTDQKRIIESAAEKIIQDFNLVRSRIMVLEEKPQATSNKRQKLQASSNKPIIVLQSPVVTPQATSS